MAGMQVIVVECENGNINVEDLGRKLKSIRIILPVHDKFVNTGVFEAAVLR